MRCYYHNEDLEDLAIVEQPETAESAARYSEANGWKLISRATFSLIWRYRNEARLYQLRAEDAKERAVGAKV